MLALRRVYLSVNQSTAVINMVANAQTSTPEDQLLLRWRILPKIIHAVFIILAIIVVLYLLVS